MQLTSIFQTSLRHSATTLHSIVATPTLLKITSVCTSRVHVHDSPPFEQNHDCPKYALHCVDFHDQCTTIMKFVVCCYQWW